MKHQSQPLREMHEAEQERIRAMLDSSPMHCALFDEAGNCLEVNQAAVEFFGFTSKQQYIDNFHRLTPEYQPDGTHSLTAILENNKKLINGQIEGGKLFFPSWIQQTLDGDIRPVEVTLMHLKLGEKDVIIAHARDIRKEKAMLAELEAARERELEQERMRIEMEAMARQRQIYDANPIASSLWDANLNPIDCNEAVVRLLGLSCKEEYIERFRNFAPENQNCGTPSTEYFVNAVEQCRKLGTYSFPWVHLTSKGEPVPGEVTAVRIDLPDGHMFAVFMVDLRKIEAALEKEREASELSRTFMDASPMCIELRDADGNLIYCNQQVLDVLEVPSKEAYAERFAEFSAEYQPCGTHSDEKFEILINKALTEGTANFEWLHLTSKGEPVPMDVTLVRILRQGRHMLVCYSLDLRPIREAERNHRFIYDSFPIPASMWSSDYRVLDCNEAMVAFLGLPNKEETLRRFYEFSTDVQPCGTPTAEKCKWVIDKVMNEGEIVKHHWNHLVNGEIIPVEVTVERVPLGEKYVCACYAIDLRPTKEVMDKIHGLEMKLLEERSHAKSAFLAKMSHEVRTPISVIMGISGIELQNPGISPRTEEAFAKIQNSSNLLLSLVNDILDLSKIESGKMVLSPDKYEVASMVADAAQLHLAHTRGKDITFRLNVDANLPAYLVGDVVRIVQILNNLLSNAFKYTESGFVELTLTGQKNDQNITTMVITVKDTGYGMTAEQVKNINTEYTRFHEDGNRLIEGVGLGMSIVYNLVQLMGARIEIESEVDVGTKVTVSIPQKIAGVELLGMETAENLQRFNGNATAVAKRFSFIPEPMPYGRVLVVDDIDDNLYVAKGLLAFYALTVETCNSGQEAVKKIKDGNVYDLVLLDQMMPGMTGTEVLQKMREMGYTKPIVVLTANAMIGQAEAFIKSGFDGFISKPIQTNHLNTILNKYIRDKQPQSVIEAAKATGDAAPPDIQNYQHSDELLNKLRLDFAKKYGNMCTDIRNAIAAEDTKTAHLLAHTLKSVSGLIHELPLMEAAKHIECLVVDGKTPDMQCLSNLENELKRVIEDIGANASSPEGNVEYLSIPESIALLDKVAPLLKNRSADSISKVDELRKIPGASALCDKIENFDFKAASEILSELKSSLAQ